MAVEKFVAQIDTIVAALQRSRQIALMNAPDVVFDGSAPADELAWMARQNEAEDAAAVDRARQHVETFVQPLLQQLVTPPPPPPAESATEVPA